VAAGIGTAANVIWAAAIVVLAAAAAQSPQIAKKGVLISILFWFIFDMLTLGTGIGTAIFHRGNLLPNTEFGHLDINGKEAEHRASDAARQSDDLSWKKYARRLNIFLAEMERLFWPDLFIIGGGISKKSEKYVPLLEIKTPVVPAQFLNEAGIVGAALAAAGENK